MGIYGARTEEFLEMEAKVRAILGREKAAIWWDTPNPMLGGGRPVMLVAYGFGHRVRRFIDEAEDANSYRQPMTQEVKQP